MYQSTIKLVHINRYWSILTLYLVCFYPIDETISWDLHQACWIGDKKRGKVAIPRPFHLSSLRSMLISCSKSCEQETNKRVPLPREIRGLKQLELVRRIICFLSEIFFLYILLFKPCFLAETFAKACYLLPCFFGFLRFVSQLAGWLLFCY